MTHKFTLIFQDEDKYRFFKEFLMKGVEARLFSTIDELNLPTRTKFDSSPCVSADLVSALLSSTDIKSYKDSTLRDIQYLDEAKYILLTISAPSYFKTIYDKVDISSVTIKHGHLKPVIQKKVIAHKSQLMLKDTVVADICNKELVNVRKDLLPFNFNSLSEWSEGRYSENKLSLMDCFWIKHSYTENWANINLYQNTPDRVPTKFGYFTHEGRDIYRNISLSEYLYEVENVIHQICTLIGINHTKYFYIRGNYSAIHRVNESTSMFSLTDVFSSTKSLDELISHFKELNEKSEYLYKILLLDSLTLNVGRTLDSLMVYVNAETLSPIELAPLQNSFHAFSDGITLSTKSCLIEGESLSSLGHLSYEKLKSIFPKEKYYKLMSTLDSIFKNKLIYTAEEIIGRA